MRIPAGLAWWAAEPGGAEWLARLPSLVAECVETWSLRVGPPFEPATISLVAPVTLADGERAVLKVNFPEPESEHEAQALARWDGEGAVRLLAHDPDRRALLLERCEPGTQLWSVPELDATRVAAEVLGRLWRARAPGGPFQRLADEAARWTEELPVRWERLGRPIERRVVDEALAFLAAPAAGDEALLHQDLHGGDVLRAERGWLAIDPKPLFGERAFDVASMLRDRRPEFRRDRDPVGTIRRRLDVFEEELGLDRERMRGWGIVHALAWGMEVERVHPEILACAGWVAAAR